MPPLANRIVMSPVPPLANRIVMSPVPQGVSAERLPRLFRKYTGFGGDAGGSGLGLAICKGLVEAHGGRIRAESAGPGRGTRFWVAGTLT